MPSRAARRFRSCHAWPRSDEANGGTARSSPTVYAPFSVHPVVVVVALDGSHRGDQVLQRIVDSLVILDLTMRSGVGTPESTTALRARRPYITTTMRRRRRRQRRRRLLEPVFRLS